MKKITLIVTVFLVVALLAVTYPAVVTAAGGPVGEKIRVRDASIEFPAGAPFYIQHGWIQTSEDGAIGIFDFQLEVDGVLVREDFKDSQRRAATRISLPGCGDLTSPLA